MLQHHVFLDTLDQLILYIFFLSFYLLSFYLYYLNYQSKDSSLILFFLNIFFHVDKEFDWPARDHGTQIQLLQISFHASEMALTRPDMAIPRNQWLQSCHTLIITHLVPLLFAYPNSIKHWMFSSNHRRLDGRYLNSTHQAHPQ